MSDAVDRGTNGRLKRLPELDLESYNDFLMGMRSWMFTEQSVAAGQRARERTEEATANGAALPFARAREIFEADQMIAVSQRMWISCQLMAHRSLGDGFERNADALLARYAAAEQSAMGSLELNPDLVLPEYVRHEFHIQPGGYSTAAVAGAVYHYGTNSFYLGANDQDGLHYARARELTPPADGKVERIIDLGCGVAQFDLALKDLHPAAEVWAIDAAAPMLRYAHARAVELGVPVHFAQRLAEDTKFPDAYFDVATANILFHEVSPEGAANIIKEAWRILRPGGVLNIIDFRMDCGMDSGFSPYFEYRLWADYYYNNEYWVPDYYNHPFTETLAQQGFDLSYVDPVVTRGMLKKYIARKPELLAGNACC